MSDVQEQALAILPENKVLGTTLCKFDDHGRLVIPAGFNAEIASAMWQELIAIEKVTDTAKWDLIAAMNDRLGRAAATRMVNEMGGTTPAYVDKASSIAQATKKVRQEFPNLTHSQCAELAKAADRPKLQHEAARLAHEHSLTAISVRAIVRGTDERTEKMKEMLLDLQNCLDGLGEHDDEWRHKALMLAKQFVRKYDGRPTTDNHQ